MTPLGTSSLRHDPSDVSGDPRDALSVDDLAVAFAALAGNSDDLIALLDFNGRLLFINEAGRQLVGLATSEDVRERNVCDFVPASAAERIRANEIPSVLGEGRWKGEGQLRNSRGELVDVVVNSFLIHHGTPARPLCIATVQRDITERKRQEKSIRASEERFRQLAENIEAVFWVSEVDPRRILYVNPAFE